MLSTLFPRLATAVKVAALFVWIGLSVVVDIGHGLGWFGYWTPTGNGVLKVIPQQVAAQFAQLGGSGGDTTLALRVQQQLPDLAPWAGPHLALVVIGIGCAVAAGFGFRRFQNT